MSRHYRPAILRHLATLAGSLIVASVITSAPVSLLQPSTQASPTAEAVKQPVASFEISAAQPSPAAAVVAQAPAAQPTPPGAALPRAVTLPVGPQPVPDAEKAAHKPVPTQLPGSPLASADDDPAAGELSGSLQSLSLEVAEVDPSPAPAAETSPTAMPPSTLTAVPTAAPTPSPTAAPTAPPAPAPTAAPQPAQGPSFRVGIQVGHWKNAELPDELTLLKGSTGAAGSGWTELAVNQDIAKRVADILAAQNIQVDLLPATVPVAYRADAFVAIHADANSNTKVSGFKAARARWSTIPQEDDALVNALRNQYGTATGLPEHAATITANMTAYYAFNNRLFKHAVHPETPSAIFETVFMTTPSDRQFIQEKPDKVAAGIATGILKFLGTD